MTKISELLGQTPGQQVNKKGTEKTGTDNDLFKKALENAVSNKSTAVQTPQTQSLGEIRATGLTMIANASPETVASKTASLLSVMDHYIDKLNDPSVSMKQLEPIAEKMKAESSELQAEAKTIDDNKLKEIAERSAVEANVEYFKFRRGDYI